MQPLTLASLLRFTVVAGAVTLLLPVSAASVVSSTRSIYVVSPTSPGNFVNRTTPGAFVVSRSTGADETTSATQDSTYAETATLLHFTGNGSTSAKRDSSASPSVAHLGESFFDATFTLQNNSSYVLTGRLTVADAVPLSGSPKNDNSSALVQLMQLSGPLIFTSNANGSFSRAGVLAGGNTYTLHIGSKISLQSSALFAKTNDWTFDLLASDVPEPATAGLGLLGIAFLINFAAAADCL